MKSASRGPIQNDRIPGSQPCPTRFRDDTPPITSQLNPREKTMAVRLRPNQPAINRAMPPGSTSAPCVRETSPAADLYTRYVRPQSPSECYGSTLSPRSTAGLLKIHSRCRQALVWPREPAIRIPLYCRQAETAVQTLTLGWFLPCLPVPNTRQGLVHWSSKL